MSATDVVELELSALQANGPARRPLRSPGAKAPRATAPTDSTPAHGAVTRTTSCDGSSASTARVGIPNEGRTLS